MVDTKSQDCLLFDQSMLCIDSGMLSCPHTLKEHRDRYSHSQSRYWLPLTMGAPQGKRDQQRNYNARMEPAAS